MEDVLLVTGGAGFIGTNLIRAISSTTSTVVVNIDCLSYASNKTSLDDLAEGGRYHFFQADINEEALTYDLLQRFKVRGIIHCAAESHVDRSIVSPENFVHSNVNGTFHLLEASRRYWQDLHGDERNAFRFVHVSTDEVYGSLGPQDAPFTEDTQYAPNSPYAASKAASDHFVRAYFKTFGLPVLTTHCSNNFGPYQYPEKLIPLAIARALAGDPIPVYGSGTNVRDWIFVTDHCAGLMAVLERGIPGATYNFGGGNEISNLGLVYKLCDLLQELRPRGGGYRGLVSFVDDRPGHDFRYAISSAKANRDLRWTPGTPFQKALRDTVRWYLEQATEMKAAEREGSATAPTK